jgi:nucleotide-binding universal stress UspA family protein
MQIPYTADGSTGALAAAHLFARLAITEEWQITILTVCDDDPTVVPERA